MGTPSFLIGKAKGEELDGDTLVGAQPLSNLGIDPAGSDTQNLAFREYVLVETGNSIFRSYRLVSEPTTSNTVLYALKCSVERVHESLPRGCGGQ
jgi:hypothetical protein